MLITKLAEIYNELTLACSGGFYYIKSEHEQYLDILYVFILLNYISLFHISIVILVSRQV